jgi:hypothetical protein
MSGRSNFLSVCSGVPEIINKKVNSKGDDMTTRWMSSAKSQKCHGRAEASILMTFAVFLLLVIFPGMPASSAAEETDQQECWQFGADVYLWVADIGGETAGGDTIDVPFHTLLENLDFSYMGAFHARNGRWHLSTDVIYMNLEGDNSGTVTAPGEIELKVDAKVKVQAWVVSPAVGYTFIDMEKIRMEFLAGARYLWMKPELKLNITGPLNSNHNISDSGDVWDGIAGIRGDVNLAKDWYIPYYADMGTGDSDYTWQAMAGVGYRINKMVDVVASYRYLKWKFEDNKAVDNLDLSGPLLGLRLRF